jgi:predicted metal-binding membrane protein
VLTSPAAPAGEEPRSGLAGAILIAAGLYQFSLLKDVCLRHCQSPLGFFMTHWREGNAGAFRLGLAHGAHCIGCCWALMGLLFIVGVMNLVWVAALSVFVVVEKCLAHGRPWVLRVAGFALIGWGLAIVVW